MYLSYVGIRVRDLERSLRFYQDLFGLHEVARGDNSKQGAEATSCSATRDRDRILS